MKTNKFEFGRVIKKLINAKKDVPLKIANVARKNFVGAFKKQGWDGKPWAEVDRRKEGTKAYKYPKKKGLQRRTKPILVKTGTLRREVNNSIRSYSWKEIRLGLSDVAYYGEFHNKGGKHLPKREFMGTSEELKREIRTTLRSELKNIFQ